MSTIEEVYEQYKHLDGCLSDPEWCTSGEGAAIYAIAGELWRAVKESREKHFEMEAQKYPDVPLVSVDEAVRVLR